MADEWSAMAVRKSTLEKLEQFKPVIVKAAIEKKLVFEVPSSNEDFLLLLMEIVKKRC